MFSVLRGDADHLLRCGRDVEGSVWHEFYNWLDAIRSFFSDIGSSGLEIKRKGHIPVCDPYNMINQ